MKSVAVIAALGAIATASPLVKRAPTDEQILNYALTLEHLENAFYSGALQKFDNASFTAVGADYGRFSQIAQHEASHVEFLTTALGSGATQACNYTFPYNTVPEFVALASVLESVGVSAYLGAAGYLQNPAFLTAAGSILTTESRHQAYISYVSGNAPWSGPYDTPQDLNQIYSLAAPFITSCPKSNPALPVKAFPALNLTGNATSGSVNVGLASGASNSSSSPLYVVYYHGLDKYIEPVSNNAVKVPDALNGTVFAIVTNQNSTNVTDANTVAGPAIVQLYSRLTVPGGSGSTSGGGQLNATVPGAAGGEGNNGGGSGSGTGAAAGAVGVKGASVVGGLLLTGLAAVLL